MKIAIVINGTRGDVQPMLALATGLISKGNEIVFCAPPENKGLVEQYNVPFIEFGPNYKELFQKNAQIKGGATAAPTPKEMKKQTGDQISLLPELIKGSDLVLGVGFVLGVHTVADILKIPYRFVIFYPALLGTCKTDPFIYRMMFGFGRSMTNMAMKSFINKKRSAAGLKSIKDVWEHWMGDLVIAACDKELNEVREGVSFQFKQTGYMLLPSKNGLPNNVKKFLDEGNPPIYIGFGSNPVAKPEKYSQVFKKVSLATKQRLIISKGWAGLSEENSANILFVDEMPFEQLFPRLSGIIFHGGTGTMAVAARVGTPQIAFPFMADQFENSKQIVRLGIGPKTNSFKKMTEDILISSINEIVKNDEYKKNALGLSRKLQNSNGLELTIELIENEFKS